MKGFDLLTEYLKKYKNYLFIGLIMLLCVDGFQIIIPWLIKKAVDILTTGNGAQGEIIWIGIYILLLAAGIGVTRFVWRYCIIGISRKIEEELRNRFYRHLQRLSFSYFDQTTVGDLMAHATNDLEAVRMMMGMALVASTDAALLMVASLVMMLSINPGLTLYVLIPLPVVTVTVLFFGPKMHKRFMAVQEGFSDLTQKAQETFSGIRVVKSFSQEADERANFETINVRYVDENLKLVRIWGLLHPIIWTISGVCSMIILLVGGNRVIQGVMSMGEFVAFNSYLGILVWPMIAIGWVVNLYQRGKASLDRLVKILSIEPEITNPEESYSGNVKGEICFRNLTFSYVADEIVLRNINLTIKPGQWVALMGPTGSSKTTLIDLISRLYDPPSKSIFVDGVDIRDWNLFSLRSQIAFVPQQTFLFSDTVANNIRFGTDIPIDQVEALAKAARVYNDVDQFPERFETLVGERGVSLSGGQKQRIAIARALAVNAPVIILDDALAAVDTETEEEIIENLKRIARQKTILMVSHRVSTARQADWIVFFEDGEIVEQGTHQQLLDLQGRYYEIHEHQRLLEEIERDASEVMGGEQ